MRKPRAGSLAAFEERFKLELAAAVRSGVDFPFMVALLAANLATKRKRRNAEDALKAQEKETT